MKRAALVFIFIHVISATYYSQTSKGWDVSATTTSNMTAGNTYALIIGVSKYKNLTSQLKYADKDASVFYNYLITSGVAPQNVHLLLNENALKGNIWAEVEYLLDVAKRGDKVYVYFSGHGDVEHKTIGHKAYLLPYDSETHGYVSCAVGIPDLKDYFATLSASGIQLIFIGDACRVGNLSGGMEGISTTASILKEQWTDEIKILSCQPGQLSQESKQWGDGRGLFSFELINGLCGKADRNRNNEITLRELELYLLEKVPEAADPNQQDPIVETKTKDYVISYLNPAISMLAAEQPSNLLATIDLKGSEDLLLENVDRAVRDDYHHFQDCMDSANYVRMEGAEWRTIYSSNDTKTQLLPSALYYYHRIPQNETNEMLLAFMKRNLSAELMNHLQSFMQNADKLQEPITPEAGQDFTKSLVVSMVDRQTLVSAEADALKQLIGQEKLKKLGFYSKGILLESINPKNFRDKEKLNEMNALLDSALYYEPELPELNFMKGAYLASMNQIEASKKYFHQEIRLNPLYGYSYGQLGAVYFKENKLDSMYQLFRDYINEAKKLPPSPNREMQEFNSLYFVTSRLISFALKDSAQQYYLELVKTHLPDMEADRATGLNFFISYYGSYFGFCDEAIKYYDAATANGAYDGSAMVGIAICLAKSNEFEKARNYLELIEKQDQPTYYDIACVYSVMHDEKKASKHFETFLSTQKAMVPFKHIMSDPDIEFFRTTKQFNALMKKHFPAEYKSE